MYLLYAMVQRGRRQDVAYIEVNRKKRKIQR